MRKRVILASASPRRKEILERLSVKFEVMVADVDENAEVTKEPSNYVCKTAKKKADAVAKKLADKDKKNLIIIAADTAVYCDKILGKPKDKDQAEGMLRMMSGKTHQVYTGVAIISYDKNGQADAFDFADKTDVTMWELSDYEIDQYIASGEGFDKAGGYGIQGQAAWFIKKINGDYLNVVGLPVSRIHQELKIRGIDVDDIR